MLSRMRWADHNVNEHFTCKALLYELPKAAKKRGVLKMSNAWHAVFCAGTAATARPLEQPLPRN